MLRDLPLLCNSQQYRALALYPEQSASGWNLLHHIHPLTSPFYAKGTVSGFSWCFVTSQISPDKEWGKEEKAK